MFLSYIQVYQVSTLNQRYFFCTKAFLRPGNENLELKNPLPGSHENHERFFVKHQHMMCFGIVSPAWRRNRVAKIESMYLLNLPMKVMYKRNRFIHSRMEAFSGFLRLPWDVLCFEKPGPAEFFGISTQNRYS